MIEVGAEVGAVRCAWMLATDESKVYVRSAPPWMVVGGPDMAAAIGLNALAFGPSKMSAWIGNSIGPLLRVTTVPSRPHRPCGIMALTGRRRPSSPRTRILNGVLFGPCQSSMLASTGRPSLPTPTSTLLPKVG